MKPRRQLILTLLAAAFAGSVAPAAPITWSPAVAPAGASDVITSGALVLAWDAGGNSGNRDVSGVPFVANTGPGTSNSGTGTFFTLDGGETGDSNLNAILDSHSYWGAGAGSSHTFQLTGLSLGHAYQVQIWAVGDTRACCASRQQRYGDGEAAQGFSDYLRRDSGGAVVGQFTAHAATQNITVNSHPDAGNTDPGLSALQLRDLGPSDDADGDGLPDAYEDAHPPLDKTNFDDAALDFDDDGLTNLEEFTHGSDPNNPDTDGDGLTDGDEVTIHLTDPTVTDSDGDGFDDGLEITLGSDPNNPADRPFLTITTVLGAGTTAAGTDALIGGDLTDPEDDGVEGATPADPADWALLNWNWTDITASNEPYFHGFGGNEGAFDIFDNKVGGGEAKWCCGGAFPQLATVQFPAPTVLTHFTVTSGNDADGRDPRIWGIYGSNDGTSFTPIYSRSDAPGTAIWTARNQTIRFDLPAPSGSFSYIQFRVDAVRTGGFQLCEVEYFGEVDPGDSDGGGLLDLYENLLGLDPGDPDDDTGDLDGDGLNNAEEAANSTNPNGSDTDNDGLNDGDEVKVYGTNPLSQDTDGDGLTDGDEVHIYDTDPLNADTDGDGWADALEIAEGSDPNEAGDVPNLTSITSLGIGAGALLGGDITNPENDGVQGPGDGLNFDWSAVSSSGETYFGGTAGNPGEGALDIFDNEVGGGSAKWCCDPAPQWAAVHFKTPHALTHFTVTSGNDTPDRDPNDWSIQGSINGVDWIDIYPAPGTNDASFLGSPWTQRNEVVRFDLPSPSPFYTHFRYFVNQVRGPNFTLHQLNEVEFFGTPDTADSDGDGIPDWYENLHAFLNPNDDGDAALDQDGDGLNNFAEFASCTDPQTGDGVLTQADGELIQSGQPVTVVETIPDGVDYGVLFQRIRDAPNYGLSYTVEFTHDLDGGFWFPSTDPGTVIADGGGAEVVKVNYPFFLPNGRKARWWRLTISAG